MSRDTAAHGTACASNSTHLRMRPCGVAVGSETLLPCRLHHMCASIVPVKLAAFALTEAKSGIYQHHVFTQRTASTQGRNNALRLTTRSSSTDERTVMRPAVALPMMRTILVWMAMFIGHANAWEQIGTVSKASGTCASPKLLLSSHVCLREILHT